MKLYISFGQGHVHTINGLTFDKDCIAVIEGEDYQECRSKAFKYFGGKFCLSYSEEDLLGKMHYFPRGFINVEKRIDL